jgi:hypothetical protein
MRTVKINRNVFGIETSSTGQGRPTKATLRHRAASGWAFRRLRMDRDRNRRPEGGVFALLEGSK